VTAPRTVVFDLGGVLVPPSRVVPRLAAGIGVDPAAFAAAYWPPRTAFDLGGSAQEYWSAVVTALGREPEPALLRRLTDIDAHKWSVLPDESAALLAVLAGERITVLSNAPGPLAAAVRAAPWTAAVQRLVFSAEVGLVKPDPAVYARADEEFGTEPGEVVFFDDRPENVAAARAHGWDAHVWEGPDAALAVLGVPRAGTGGRPSRDDVA
jgi:putative hydrolase of the HAD superfamily